MMKAELILHFARNGNEVIEYLSGLNQYADRLLFPLPILLVLDNKMPRKNGFEVLEWLNQNKIFTSLPVVMLSSSKMPSDIGKARELGAKAYLVKPLAPNQMKQLFTDTEAFLVSCAAGSLPTEAFGAIKVSE